MTSAVEGRDLTFAYGRRAQPILESWSGKFAWGEMVALTGASGRGKSTLLYLLGLMTRPTSGEVLVGGAPTTRLKDAERARLRAASFGFVFQDAALDPSRSVLDNVCESALYRGVSRNQARAQARELLAKFGVDHRCENRPGQVSGGQAQRIALSRALLSSPRLILADEPTGNLDRVTASVVMSAFREAVGSGATAVIATHDPEVVAQCDRSIHL